MFQIPLSESALQPFFMVQSKKSKRGIRRQGLHIIDCVVCIPLSPLGTIDQTQIQDDGLFAPRGDTEHRPPQTNRRANGPKDADLRYGASPSTSSFSQYRPSFKQSLQKPGPNQCNGRGRRPRKISKFSGCEASNRGMLPVSSVPL